MDGGNVRVRSPLGKPSVWKNYKAVQTYDDIVFACFQSNETLEKWVNQQPLGRVVTCLGDGHDGIWNIMENLGNSGQRREV